MIKGVGTDIIEVDRIQAAIAEHGKKFTKRIFTSDETAYCENSARPYQRFATRFAAKEAVLKALGVGWQKGTKFTDIEVVKNNLGAPALVLKGKSLEISREMDIKEWFLSLSHSCKYAIAYAVAEGG